MENRKMKIVTGLGGTYQYLGNLYDELLKKTPKTPDRHNWIKSVILDKDNHDIYGLDLHHQLADEDLIIAIDDYGDDSKK